MRALSANACRDVVRRLPRNLGGDSLSVSTGGFANRGGSCGNSLLSSYEVVPRGAQQGRAFILNSDKYRLGTGIYWRNLNGSLTNTTKRLGATSYASASRRDRNLQFAPAEPGASCAVNTLSSLDARPQPSLREGGAARRATMACASPDAPAPDSSPPHTRPSSVHIARSLPAARRPIVAPGSACGASR